MKVPTVCHLCEFSPEYGGAFIESLIFLSRYCRDHLQVATFCVFPERAKGRSWLSILDKEGIGYGFVPHKKNVVGDICRLLSDREPLILHSHFFFFDLTTILLKCLAFKKVKVIWHYRNPAGGSVKQDIKDALKIRILFNLFGDSCIAVGDGVYKTIIDAGMMSKKAMCLYNGINTDRYLPKPEVRLELRKGLGIPDKDIVFALVGLFPVRKGVDIFLRAAGEFARKHEGCRYLVVGRRETREFIGRLHYASSLGEALLVTDPVSDFSTLLNGVDVFVTASRSEGFGNAVVEAMAAKRMVLCSDIAPVRQTYGRSEGVWLYPSEDWQALAELMGKVVQLSSDEKQSLGLTNRQYVIDNHSLDWWCREIANLYNDLVE